MKLRTQLPIDECKSRLRSSMDVEKLGLTLSGFAGSKEILGKIHDTEFRLQKRRSYRNSFAPLFYGQLKPTDGGTLIGGEFKMHPFMRVFMFFWFSFVGLFAIAAFILLSRGQPEATAGRIGMVLTATFMMVFGGALVKFGRWLARSERHTITAFLKSTLEAHDIA